MRAATKKPGFATDIDGSGQIRPGKLMVAADPIEFEAATRFRG